MALTQRDRRALLLLVAVVLPVFAALYGLPPYLRHRSASIERAAAQRALLARERDLLRDTLLLRRALDSARVESRQLGRSVLRATTPAEAGSAVGEQLRAHARRSGLQILRVGPPQVGPAAAGWSEVRVEVDARAAFPAAVRFFAALQADPLRLRVERWLTERAAPVDPMMPPQRDEDRELRVGLTVAALVRIGTLSDGAAP